LCVNGKGTMEQLDMMMPFEDLKPFIRLIQQSLTFLFKWKIIPDFWS